METGLDLGDGARGGCRGHVVERRDPPTVHHQRLMGNTVMKRNARP
jgi:hypothetical protein